MPGSLPKKRSNRPADIGLVSRTESHNRESRKAIFAAVRKVRPTLAATNIALKERDWQETKSCTVVLPQRCQEP